MEQWLEIRKSGRFDEIGKKFDVDEVVARVIRNRDVIEEKDIQNYLYGTLDSMGKPDLLKDAAKAADILQQKIKEQKKIRIIGDYDIDGIMSTYILLSAIQHLGGVADTELPDRIKDGYGVNEQLIEQAISDGVDTIITCDNGIAAKKELESAKEKGLTVIVTDHHEIPFEETNGSKKYRIPQVDAVVDPKQKDCTYPYKEICGAVVAWKVIQLLYRKMNEKTDAAEAFMEYAAFATVGDVMDLRDENRILVKEGLKRLNQTTNLGLKTLIKENQLEDTTIKAYHIGFILGPCLNASGRLDTAKKALKLLCETDELKATALAKELTELNTVRKELTRAGVEQAREQIRTSAWQEQKVYVIYLPDCHESIAGIIAGRIREEYYRPVFVLTKANEGVKGSGRSVENYSMYEELCKCEHLLDKFGGHPMAAGLSMQEKNIEQLRLELNRNTKLQDCDIQPVIRFDAVLDPKDWNMDRINQLGRLEPFGKGNEKPIFAAKNLRVERVRRMGKTNNVQRMTLVDGEGYSCEAVYFGDTDVIEHKNARILYYPQINTYQGIDSIQFVISRIFQ